MSDLLPDLVLRTARHRPDAEALKDGTRSLSFGDLADQMDIAARGFIGHELDRGERVAVYHDKRIETVVALLAASRAGGVFVPINPLLKPRQVAHILRNCNVRILVTSASRAALLRDELHQCHDLRSLIVLEDNAQHGPDEIEGVTIATWRQLMQSGGDEHRPYHRVIDVDMTAILYTSGSTGSPKGVVLSHRNLVVGARSVSHYLENTPDDLVLSVLPLSFDAGLSQLTTAFSVGATVVLMNYLLPRDALATMARERITGVTGVPSLWIQLAGQDWPEAAKQHLRYMANTGGAMPKVTLDQLRAKAPSCQFYLMYGLTEAFRSTYLPPAELDRRPDSIGKAIPNAEILVVREDGELCAPGEPGELVHRGALVALGYWNDPERTAERFRQAPGRPGELSLGEIAVWSGDTVRLDEEGFLYFVGRRDDMIKTSGYRVSPTEVEEVVYASGAVDEAVALGIAHPNLGQAIVVVASGNSGTQLDSERVLTHCRAELPGFMVPIKVIERGELPRNANGKFDRGRLMRELGWLFQQGRK